MLPDLFALNRYMVRPDDILLFGRAKSRVELLKML